MRRACIEPSAPASPHNNSDPSAGTVVCLKGRIVAERRQNAYFSGSRDSTDLVGLGNFIRTRRQTLMLTQEQLADRLGWVQERISLLEHGRYGLPSLPSLALLASAIESALGDVLIAAGFEGALETSDPGGEGEPITNPAVLSVLAAWAYQEGVQPVSSRRRRRAS
jgi:transcriptional regulator with XRE-family HTH domain